MVVEAGRSPPPPEIEYGLKVVGVPQARRWLPDDGQNPEDEPLPRFRGWGWWQHPEKSWNPENEQKGSFQGWVHGGGLRRWAKGGGGGIY